MIRGKSTSCGCSRREELTENSHKNAEQQWIKVQQKVGTIVNGFKIVRVERKKNGTNQNQTFCRVVCPVCGKESETLLSRLSHIHICVNCSRNTNEFLRKVRSAFHMEGSSLAGVSSRAKGTVNKNSKTKVNEVSTLKDGRYRAYITFKRKRYHLGYYDKIEDAIAARKEAERKIFGDYIKRHEGWERGKGIRLRR